MRRTKHEYRSAKRLARLAVVLGVVCLTILGIAGGSPAAYADGTPGGNVSDPVVRAVDIAKPAVVRIITALGGQLMVQFPTNQIVTFPQGGNPYTIVLSGSGTFITARGDILTADHVVNPPHPDLDQFLQQQAAPDVANYWNQVLRANPPVTADQVAAELASGQLHSSTQYTTPQSRVYLSTDYTGPLSVTDINNVPSNQYAAVDRIEKQSSFNDEDVAIIHVSGMDDQAMVQLGDSSSVAQQDQLTIIGFPGNGDIAGTSATDLLTLSVNQVYVSSMKTTNSGAPVIQVGGNVEHGDSGGPALDSHGTIVGIVSFGAAGQGSTSFLQASNSARTLVQSLGLNTTPGPFQKAWSQAFMDYASNAPGHWHKAQREFQQITAQYPSFKAVTLYLNYTTTQATSEKLPKPTPTAQPASTGSTALSTNWIIIGAGVVLLLVLLLFGVVVLRRRGKQAPATVAPARSFNTPPPVSMPPYNMPPAPVVQNGQMTPGQPTYRSAANDGLTAFGAPPSPVSPWPVQPPAQPVLPGQSQRIPPQSMPTQPSTFSTNSPTVPSAVSGTLVHWPCGHVNRPAARYCSVCGEPAPPPPTVRRFEQ